MAKSKQAPKPKVARKAASKEKHTKVSADALPRRTLEDALGIAQVIRDSYAGKPTTWAEIAQARGVSASTPAN